MIGALLKALASTLAEAVVKAAVQALQSKPKPGPYVPPLPPKHQR